VTARRAALGRGIRRLSAAGVPEPGRDARLLYRWAAGLEPAALAARLEEPADGSEIARFEAAIAARAERRPVAQITGARRFWGRDFAVTPEVLDPRPETETLIAAALAEPARRILDLATGTGCILVTLLAEWVSATGIGTDLSAAALAVAARNARRHGVAGRADLVAADWFEGLAGRYDLILANPPYVATPELAELAPEVVRHEPRLALDGGTDGLAAYRRIAAGALAHLAPGGRILVEIGPDQTGHVLDLFTGAGLREATVLRDIEGRDRVISARG